MQTLLKEGRALWSARTLVWVMTRREVQSRHAGTALGLVWPYLQPLLTIATFYLVFDIVFAMRTGEAATDKGLGVFLIVGMLPWMAFSDAVSRGMNSLIEAGSVLQKNPLPPVLFVARSVLASGVIYGPLFVLMAAVYTLVEQTDGSAALALIGLVLLQLVLCLMLAYTLAIFAAALRDVVQMVGFMLSVGIYLSPILFPMRMFPEDWRWVLWLNPMSGLVTAYQAVLLDGRWPEASSWWVTVAWLVVLALVLDRVCARSRDQLVDWL
jgi:lipopolysaccharide transport system permease protein